MVQAIETGKADLVALKFTGSLDKEDYTLIVPSMEEKIDRFGKICLYWEMDDVEGWEPGGCGRTLNLTFSTQTISTGLPSSETGIGRIG
ncbi:hypothetical protein GCM10028895_50510 [Pontibacter rugosus]